MELKIAELVSRALLVLVTQLKPAPHADVVGWELHRGEFGTAQFTFSFGLGLESVASHQFQRLLVAHVHSLHADIQYGVRNYAQADLAHHQTKARIVIVESRIHHDLRNV